MRATADRDGANAGEPSRPRAAAREAAPSPAPERRTLTRRGVMRLQRSAGNAAVARLVAGARAPKADRAPAGGSAPAGPVGAAAGAVTAPGEPVVQRRADGSGGSPSPPPAPTPIDPHDDPRFATVESQVGAKAKGLRAHPPAAGEAKKASAAAMAPAGDKEAQAKAAQADKMSGAKPAGFDKAKFMAAVKAAIAAKAPKNLDEADSFPESGKADQVKIEVMGNVTKGKQDSAKDIAEKSGEAPDQSKAKDKPVTPLAPDPAPTAGAPPTGAAMPAPAPPEQTDLGAGKAETDAQMADAEVTEDQLAKSNEPEFTGALAAKKEGEQHSATAPAQVREHEAATLAQASQGAGQAGQAAVADMVASKSGALSKAAGGKGAAKSKDEAARAKVTGEIRKIFDATKAEVDKILADLDGSVAQKFEAGEKAAKAAFTADHTARMDAYKDKRYSGLLGKGRWLRDKFAGMPAEANNLFLESRKLYEAKMEVVISDVADHIGKELTRAKDRIAKGRQQIADYVASQPKELQKVAADAAGKIGDQFDKLESDVDEKQDALVDDLATRYSEARNAVDEEIKELQAANKGLWDKAKDAIVGTIRTILKLKDMLLGVLARAAGAIGKIIKDPIGFLGNLISAVKGGVQNFAANIVDHLKKGLQGFLFGSLADAGIEVPESFDLKGIIKLVLSILGLTWMKIRTKIVKRIGEAAMGAVEKGVDIFKTLATEGVGGLWKFLVDKLSDLKDTVMDAIQDFVVVKIVKAGITWLISALNPAAAFIKACKMIYDVVMFFVEKGSQIKEFVDSVLDSIESIVGGGVGAVARHIESTLAKILPLLLGFLASLLGLGGISEKIKEILEKVQKPVSKAIDFVINGALKLAAPIINLAKRGAAWVKGKVEKGKAWVKGKVEGAKTWAKGKARAVGEALGIVKRPVNAPGQSHTLSADTKTGEIRMASVEEPLSAKIRRWIEQARRHPNPQVAEDLENNLKRLTAQAAGAAVEIKRAKAGRSETAGQVLDRLAEVIAGLIVRIGAVDGGPQQLPPTENKRGIRPGLGNVTTFGKGIPADTPPPAGYQMHLGEANFRALEREHVIPVAFVSALFEALVAGLDANEVSDAVRQKIARKSSEDRSMHVVLIYKSAADLKTEGLTNTDNHVVGQIASLAAEGMPKDIRGDSVWAKERRAKLAAEHGGSHTKAYRDALTQIDDANKAAAAGRRQGLWSKMAGILNGRVNPVHGYVVKDHDELKKGPRGHDNPLPDEGPIRQAAELDANDIVAMVMTRLDAAETRSSADSE
jgi:hypothetical protein